MAETVKCDVRETAACCCVDVGTIIDNTDCTVKYSKVFSNKDDAEHMLKMLTDKARSIESEPCQISSNIAETTEGVALNIDFTFSCEAELLIFQLGLR